MKIFDIKKSELEIVLLFSALFALIEGSSALAFAASAAMFLSGVGVDGLPLAYILLFAVMLCAMGGIAAAQARFQLERVFGGFLIFSLAVTFCLSSVFSFGGCGGFSLKIALYALSLWSQVWAYAGFSLYWNFADEHFGIRDGKRLYSVFGAAGCFGAIIGASSVYLVSEYWGAAVHILLWVWAACVFLSVVLVSQIGLKCKKLDSGAGFESEAGSWKKALLASASGMLKSPYVRAMFLMYVMVIIAASINEFVAMSAFSNYADGLAAALGEASAEVMNERSALELASLFGALGVGVNVFNFTVNLFVFNRLVSKLGVGNVALIQSCLYIAAFIWLINSFGIAAAVFSFFIYRGVMESIDANNENLMISVIPGNVRQQVRLVIESLIVPFSTALAGAFLMLYAKGEKTFGFGGEYMERLSETLGFGSLGVGGISLVGLAVSVLALMFAFSAQSRYPKMLEKNLREGWLDCSRSLREILAESGETDFDRLAKKYAGNRQMLMSLAELEYLQSPAAAVGLVLRKDFTGESRRRAEEFLLKAFENPDTETVRAALDWLADNSVGHPRYALNAAVKAGGSVRAIVEKMSASEAATANSPLACKGGEDGKSGFEAAMRGLYSPNPAIRDGALVALSKIPNLPRSVRAEMAAHFKAANAEGKSAILRSIGRPSENLHSMFRGVLRFPVSVGRKLLASIAEEGATAVPHLVGIIRSDSFSVYVKSVCAEALNKIFPAQLRMIAVSTARKQTAKAYEWVLAAEALKDMGAPASALADIYKWRRIECANFAILLFSLSGKIPAYETIVNALWSRGGKEKGNAIEALEEGLSRKDFRAILPLVDGRNDAQRAEFAKKISKPSGRPDTDALISAAAASPFDEDFLAAAALLDRLKSAELDAALCRKTGGEKASSLRSDLLEFIDEIAIFRFSGNEPTGIYSPQKYSAFAICGLFDGFEPQARVQLCGFAESPEGAAGEDGIAISSHSRGLSDASARKIKGGESFADGDILFVSKRDVLKVASQYPEAALSVFEGGVV